MGQGLSGWVADNCKPIFNGNPAVEPGYLRDPAKISALRSAISVPLQGLTGLSGALTLYRSEFEAFSKDHLRVLLAISSKVALSIENAMKYQQAESSATTDYLTGLPNARSLFLQLDRELARCKRSNTPLAVMVCDLDGFKNINDRCGHLEGNRVLRLFANLVKDCCRDYDYVARMGGDEFVIVVPGMTPEAAREKALRLNRCALEAGVQVCGGQPLSVSVGTAFSPQHGDDTEQLLAEADRQMYRVKQRHYQDAEVVPAEPLRSTAVVN
jgi:diguanylate cyclase (GGDEF)-like protein